MNTIVPPKLDFTPILGPAAKPHDFAVLSTTQSHPYGRRYVTWDGRVFKYCRSLGTLYAGYGAANIAPVGYLINSVTPAAYVAGQQQIPVTIASAEGYAGDGAIAENELVGAHLVVGHGGATLTENRLVIGNAAVASGGGTCQVLLDEPLDLAHAAGVACELPLNPFRYLSKGNLEYNAFMCVPRVAVTTGYNFWGQTWGPCWCVPGGGDSVPGNSANDRLVCFVGDGSVNGATALTMETGYQIAGYIIDTTASGTGAMPLVMLQLSC
jgi:hypothetical protein